MNRITARKVSGTCGFTVIAGASFYLTGYLALGKFRWPDDVGDVVIPILFFMLLGVSSFLTASRHMEERLESIERRVRALESHRK